jgi:hypothetical protein
MPAGWFVVIPDNLGQDGTICAFPLILTFSRREKEQPVTDCVKLAGRQAEAALPGAWKNVTICV